MSARALVLLALVLGSGARAQTPGTERGFQPVRDAASAPAALRALVSVRLQGVTVERAVREIAARARLGVSYRPDLSGLDREVSLVVERVPAADALLRILQGSGIEVLASPHARTVLLERAARAAADSTPGRIAGVVRAGNGGGGVAHADVVLANGRWRTVSGVHGDFWLRHVPAGTHDLDVTLPGYAPTRMPVTVAPGETTVVDVLLTPVVIPLTAVVVAPGHFGLAHESAAQRSTLTRERIETLPQLGDDIYRTIGRLPGIHANELSARPTIRGGDDNAVLVTLDGLELFEPYHLKDLDGAMSILDVASIGGVDLTTGGFGAQAGNHLAALLELRTADRIPARPRTQLGLSLTNVRALSQGGFAQGNGLWLFSARRGYLDLLLRLVEQDQGVIDPRYYDLLGKVVYQLSPHHRLSVHTLHAADRTTLAEADGSPRVDSEYGSSYVWFTWHARLGDVVQARTLASAGQLEWQRQGARTGVEWYRIADQRDYRFAGVKQDWQADTGEQLWLGWGGALLKGAAEYDYRRTQRTFVIENDSIRARTDSTRAAPRNSGLEASLYGTLRARPLQPVTVELGVRWDRQSHTGEEQWSPRSSVAFVPRDGTTLRAAAGGYAQPQRLYQLDVLDGRTEFATAERATQYSLGLEQRLGAGTHLRVEAYRRSESDPRARYVNLSSALGYLPEAEPDRLRIAPVRGLADGIELLLQGELPRSSWSLTYALARAEDTFADGRTAPRRLAQRHSLYVDQTYSPSPAWRLSWSWTFHTGWPYTPASFELVRARNGELLVPVFGDFHSATLPAYHRLDVRATRDFALGSGRLSAFLDVFNVYNQRNLLRYRPEVHQGDGNVHVRRLDEPLLPLLPSFGISWEF